MGEKHVGVAGLIKVVMSDSSWGRPGINSQATPCSDVESVTLKPNHCSLVLKTNWLEIPEQTVH